MNLSNTQFDQASLTRSMVTHEWLTTFEFASTFTGFPIDFEKIETRIGVKPFVIVPIDPFDLEKCTGVFQHIFTNLNQDLDYGRLSGKHFRAGKGVNFVLSPFEGLVWTIDKGFSWPIELQTALSLRHKEKRKFDPWLKKVRAMIFKHFTVLLQRKDSPIEIWRDSMMESYLRISGDERTLRTVQKDMALVSRPRESRWQNERARLPDRLEPLKIIPDVMQYREGCCECNFILLKEVIWTAAFIIVHEVLEPAVVTKMTLPQFVQEILENEVISPYVENSSPFVVHYIEAQIAKFYRLLPEFFAVPI